MQAIEPLNKLEKIIFKRPGIIAHDYCRAASYEPDDLVLVELGRFVDRSAAKLHPSVPWSMEPSAFSGQEGSKSPDHPSRTPIPRR